MPAKTFRLLHFVLSVVVSKGWGSLFDFHVIPTALNAEDSVKQCSDLGYDGHAVLNSPEMYNYALKITEDSRNTSNAGPYIGLRNASDSNLMTWDDGSMPAEDTPWKSNAHDFSIKRYVNIHRNGKFLKPAGANYTKPAICGNHANLPTEAYGVSTLGQQAVGVSSSLSETKVFSYLECVLLCGMDHRCRAAEFDLDHLTCRTLETGSYTGVAASSSSQMFVRNGFDLD